MVFENITINDIIKSIFLTDLSNFDAVNNISCEKGSGDTCNSTIVTKESKIGWFLIVYISINKMNYQW